MLSGHPLRLLPGLVGLAVLLNPAGSGEPSLRWKGRPYKLDALPAELSPEVAEAARPLAVWAEKKGYRMELTPEADCLLVLSRRSSSSAEHLAWIAATIKAFEGVLAPRVAEPPDAAGGPTPPERKRLEDFDLPPLTPEVEMPRLPHQIPILLEARNSKDYESALGALVESCPWLGEWAEARGKGAYGLVLPRPLLGAWLADAPANEEWDPRNELVNRLAQLIVIERAGVQPYWLLAGLAWEIELSVRGGIFCFPYRSGFVGVEEHGGWAARLSTLFAERAERPPTAGEIAGLKRGVYVDDQAAVAWGAARWLMKEQRAALPPLLADLDQVRRKQGIEVRQDGSWTTIPDWDWPDEVLDEILRRHLGPDAFERLGQAFRAGL